jgi:Uma2 family endonuclease
MTNELKTLAFPPRVVTVDRPGWIPPEITQGWDADPYAYQTEEELMPAGGLHGQLLAYIMELLRHLLEARQLMLLMDVFLLYRDESHTKQRIGPDLLLMPYRFPPPSAYDLDVAMPPLCLMEVTSPDSHLRDLEAKAAFYVGLGVPTYLVIDAITPRGQLRKKIELHLWRLVDGQPRELLPEADGGFVLPEMGFKVLTEGQRIRFIDLATGAVALDSGELRTGLEAERRARLQESEARLQESEARLQEHEARLKAEAEVARLQAELKKLRGNLS